MFLSTEHFKISRYSLLTLEAGVWKLIFYLLLTKNLIFVSISLYLLLTLLFFFQSSLLIKTDSKCSHYKVTSGLFSSVSSFIGLKNKRSGKLIEVSKMTQIKKTELKPLSDSG